LILPNLEKNIKCGNSLIDDPEFTDKPFKWKIEFPEIFKEGGFDVVIGNPPYVRQEKIKEIKTYLENHYEVYTGVADLFVYFFEKGLNLLKKGGIFSYICSNKFTQTKNDGPLRKFILDHKFLKYIDFTGKNVFADVTTNHAIFVIKNEKINNNKLVVNDEFEIPQDRLDECIWSFKDPKILDLKDKLDKKGLKLRDMSNLRIYYGIKTGYENAFIIDKDTKDLLLNEDYKNKEIIKPVIKGKNLKKYRLNFKDTYLLFTRRGTNIENYPSIKSYLCQFKERLTPRNEDQKIGRKPGDYKWYEIQDTIAYYEEFRREKIIWGNLSIKPNFSYSNTELYINAPANLLVGENIKYLLTILNSKVTGFIFNLIGVKVDSGYLEWKKNRVEQLPIYPATYDEQKPFIENADEMLELNKNFQIEINSFNDWIMQTFKIEKLSQKLEKYYELSFENFLNEVKKKKVNVKSRENYQTLKEEFEKSITIINLLLQQIKETDKEIDQMVYDLYGLTPEEIKIIEDSLNG
jgi:hypothetical protein